MPPEWLIACDLDQTLIYSERAFRLLPGAPRPDVVIAEYLDGEPLSYLTRAARDGLRALARRVPVMPVTTRTLAQYGRVDLGFVPAYAIAGNGGHLLVDGVADPEWAAGICERLARSGRPLGEVRALADRLATDAPTPWVRTIRDADGLFVYLVATEREAIPDLTAAAAELASGGWALSVQGRKVYLVPAALTKEAAIAEVLRRTGAEHLAAAGDSLLDAGMLAMARQSPRGVAIRPAHGELHEQQLALEGLQVTDRDGLLGGQEVVERLTAAVAEMSGSGEHRDFSLPPGMSGRYRGQ